jgi:hypothetical protein
MGYKLIAWIIVLAAVLVPLVGIVYLGLNFSFVWFLAILIHIWFLSKSFGIIKRISLDESGNIKSTSGSGGNDTIGTAEKVVTVIENKDGKKKIK